MRVFIAIELPDSIRKALAQEQERFRAAAPDARWTRPEGIHLTLKFLGEISSEQEAQVKQALGRMERFESSPFGRRTSGSFPNAKRPRRFLGLALTPRPTLARLAEQVESAMASIGFQREDRHFNPHLTLARFKVPRPQPRLEALLKAQGPPDFGTFDVSEFFLWESRLLPAGAEYRKIASFP